MLNIKDKGLVLKLNLDCFKNEHINENIGLATCEDKLTELFYEHRNEKMLHIMSLDHKTHLDSRNHGRLGRQFDHSFYPNCYVDKWKAQVYSRL